ncbi:MAG: type II/IV secretion system protein [Opitutaceae bacterium]|nr:type II/IV secretion system protein [Opitutaceae bacterium]
MTNFGVIFSEIACLESLSEEQVNELETAQRSGKVQLLASYLDIPEEEALQRLSGDAGLALADPDAFDLEVLTSLPIRIINEYHCVPLLGDSDEDSLVLATSWLPDGDMDDWIFATSGKEVSWRLAAPDKITKFVTANLGVGAESLDDSMDLVADASFSEEEEEDESAAIIRFVNQVISQAIEDGATDIHFEPQEETLRIRYRIDGLLVAVPVPENLRRIQDAITSRLKIMAKLNISERRLPQDGRINYNKSGNTLDIRLSTISTMYGESVSLRLLNKKSEPLSLEQLGLPQEDQVQIDNVLTLPHGIILVTGPTGSGKSTSLNAFIRQINSTDKRIMTIEDPIEYEVPGVNQIQVQPEIGFDFADALRHVLRQDPDTIMIGEIRDKDTADIAIRASLTGHLVFSTIHTNDAPGAITRLVDMGIEPFLIASSIEMVIAQRLIRRICSDCKKMLPVDPVSLRNSLAILDIDPEEAHGISHLPEPSGCEKCRQLGYRGRLGLFEILRVDESFHDLIVNKESARAIRKLGLEKGMRTLEQSGWMQVKKGLTSLEEVVRVVSMAQGNEEE